MKYEMGAPGSGRFNDDRVLPQVPAETVEFHGVEFRAMFVTYRSTGMRTLVVAFEVPFEWMAEAEKLKEVSGRSTPVRVKVELEEPVDDLVGAA